ncbi:hypothetical protein WKH56_09115 [Priestia sp. SB1]|uniref:hypothetical protein n=1 Tax=Priestia sp. SB1 TaxID=3132359 RepID=UPI0031790970
MNNILNDNEYDSNVELPDKEPLFNLPYLYINTKNKHYKPLKSYIKNNIVVATSHRDLPTIEKVEYNRNSGYGCCYAYGTLEEFGQRWSKLDVKIIKPVTNEEIVKVLEHKVKTIENLTLKEALKEVDGDFSLLIEAFELPVNFYD